MFLGSIVNLILPLKDDLTIDIEFLKKIAHLHFIAFTDGVLLSNEMTELKYLTQEQRGEVIQTVAEALGSRIPVIVETTGEDLTETIAFSLQAQTLGADACLIEAPAYESIQEVYNFFGELQEHIVIPLLLKDTVETSGAYRLTPKVIARLASLTYMGGVIDTNADLIRFEKLRKLLPEPVTTYTNNDSSAMEFILYGGTGAISTIANVVPKVMYDLCDAAINKDRIAAETKNLKLFSLYDLLDTGDPIAVKWALKKMGLISTDRHFDPKQLDDFYKKELTQALKLGGAL